MSFSYKGTAPTIATVISQAAGTSVNGFVKKNAGYYVYANVTDNSGTGIQSVTANVANVTTGDTAIALTAGSYTAPGGGSYNYRSALLTSNASQGDGAVSYTVNAKDNLNNTSTYSNNGSVTFDTTAPTGSVSVPAYTNSTSVSVTFSATDNTGGSGVSAAGGQLMRASATLSNGTCGSYGSYSAVGSAGVSSAYSDTTVTSGNCYEYEYVVSDNIGNQGTIGPSGSVKVDTGSPTFAISKSGSNVYTDGTANVWVKTGTTGSSFTLTATESVSGINATTVNFPTISGWNEGTVSTTATTASVTYSETVSPSTGAQSASVASNAGNSTTLNYSITADTTAPTGTVTYTNGYVTTASVSVTFSAADNTGGSGVNASTGQLMRASATLTNGSCGSFGTYSNVGSAGVTSPYNDTSVASGTCYKYEYVVSDNVSNQGTITSSSIVKVDTASPTTTITLNPSSPNGSNGWYKGTSPTFTLSATDAGGSGVATTYYEIDGGTQTAYPGAAVTIPDGSAQTISYWSVDNAGNTETTNTTAALKIDTVAPTGSITAPAANANVSGSAVTVTSNSADALSGVASAQFEYSVHSANSWTTIGTDTSSPYTVSWNTTSLTPGSYDLRVITTDVSGNSTTSAIVTVTVQGGQFSGNSNGMQVFPGFGASLYGNATASANMNSSSSANTYTFTAGSTLTNLSVTLSGTASSGGSSATLTVTVMKNGTATGLSCTIADTATTCTSAGPVSFASGNTMNIQTSRSGGGTPSTISGSWTISHT